MTAARPLLLYDGECGFCRYWVRYWARLTSTAVDYAPYQERAAALGLAPQACRQAVQLRLPDGEHCSAAAASLRVLAYGGTPLWAWLYARNRLFARLAEAVYALIAAHREGVYRAARLLWGDERYPARYARAAMWFPRLLGLVYVAAFSSLAVQVEGLLGAHGIVPAADLLEAARRVYGLRALRELPSLFWLAADDRLLVGSCILGALAGACAACGRLQWPALASAWLLYLSLFAVGRDFMSFQWDLLLLECGFLSLLLPLGTRPVSWLFRLLLFRFMFLSGCVKLLSGDPSWTTLSALDFHYYTQPLPTPLAWYAHQLPAWFDRLSVLATFFIELVLPVLVFTPRRPRRLAAAGFVLLELCILLTGNYNFFNLLTIALCVFLFDDGAWAGGASIRTPAPRRRWRQCALAPAVLVVVLGNVYYLWRPFATPPAVLQAMIAPLVPLRLVNGYGLFAVMTRTRPEIELEGSLDGRHWQAYRFRYKPGAAMQTLRWNIPHQPRLDWQMWFAALSNADDTPWFRPFLARLLANEPAVTGLLASNPFAGQAPRLVRAVLYDYRYATPAERQVSGSVWVRSPTGLYFPPARLD